MRGETHPGPPCLGREFKEGEVTSQQNPSLGEGQGWVSLLTTHL
jgi:hypothetical protein